jgi:hypothetical protein
MSRSLAFRSLARVIRVACCCKENNISASEGLERTADIEAKMSRVLRPT